MQVVIVPAWRRPEFLWACLQRLLVADREDLRYLLALDRGHTHETARIASVFRKRLGVNRVDTSVRRHAYKGNSHNVLEAYREAVRMPAQRGAVELVHLVEEDILIGADYFDYHDRAHALTPDTFAVTACRNQKYPPGVEPPADPEAVYSYPHCQSLGLSFRPEKVKEFLKHATRGYYHNPGLYCRVHFPDSQIHPGHHEQDGLINRVREANGWTTTYPAVPRAYHAGFFGYNRAGGWTDAEARMPTEAKGERLLAMDDYALNVRATQHCDLQSTPLDESRPPVTRVVEWAGQETR